MRRPIVGAAGLAGEHRLERLGEPRGVGALAAALGALEGDVAAARPSIERATSTVRTARPATLCNEILNTEIVRHHVDPGHPRRRRVPDGPHRAAAAAARAAVGQRRRVRPLRVRRAAVARGRAARAGGRRGVAARSSRTFWPIIAAGGIAQILGTIFLIRAFDARDFAIGTVFSKTEVVQVAVFSLVLLGEPLECGGWVGAVVCMVGVAVLATKGRRLAWARCASRPRCTAWLAGGMFGLASVGIRGATKALDRQPVGDARAGHPGRDEHDPDRRARRLPGRSASATRSASRSCTGDRARSSACSACAGRRAGRSRSRWRTRRRCARSVRSSCCSRSPCSRVAAARAPRTCRVRGQRAGRRRRRRRDARRLIRRPGGRGVAGAHPSGSRRPGCESPLRWRPLTPVALTSSDGALSLRWHSPPPMAPSHSSGTHLLRWRPPLGGAHPLRWRPPTRVAPTDSDGAH